MKVDRIERDGVLAELIKLRFVLAPIVLVAPIINEGAEILKVGAVGPSRIDLVRPTNLPQPAFQIEERLVRYVDSEGLRPVAGRFQHHRYLPRLGAISVQF